MPFVPQEAIKIFEGGGGVGDVVGLENFNGDPASRRTARRWKRYWELNVANPEKPEEKEREKGKVPNEEKNEFFKEFGTPEEVLQRLQSEDHISVSQEGDELIINGLFPDITTVEEVIEQGKVDMEVWKVDHFIINTWQGYRRHEEKDLKFKKGKSTGFVRDYGDLFTKPLWQVKVWFAEREEKPFEDVFESFIQRLEGAAPTYVSIKPNPPEGDFLFVPCIFDAHFGELDTTRSYTIEQANKDYKDANAALVSRVLSLGMRISRVLLPLGNDALHVDNLHGTTTRGTRQDTSADIRDAIDALFDACSVQVEQLVSVAPVDIVVIEGNHDRLLSYCLGKFLEARFSKHPDITVDARRGPRKYYQHGKNMIGMEHGDRLSPERLVSVMAVEAPKMWGTSTYREMLRGHFHRKQEVYYAATEEHGVMIRTIPALSPTYEWLKVMGFVGANRAAEGLFYQENNGPGGAFPVFINEVNGRNGHKK
jgi:hypothetical protein